MPLRRAALIAVAGFIGSPATAGIFGDAPDVIMCPLAATSLRPAAEVLHYVDGRLDDGTVVYKTLTKTPPLVSVGPDGVVRAEKLPDCNGATVQQLRDAGRAFDFR